MTRQTEQAIQDLEYLQTFEIKRTENEQTPTKYWYSLQRAIDVLSQMDEAIKKIDRLPTWGGYFDVTKVTIMGILRNIGE